MRSQWILTCTAIKLYNISEESYLKANRLVYMSIKCYFIEKCNSLWCENQFWSWEKNKELISNLPQILSIKHFINIFPGSMTDFSPLWETFAVKMIPYSSEIHLKAMKNPFYLNRDRHWRSQRHLLAPTKWPQITKFGPTKFF